MTRFIFRAAPIPLLRRCVPSATYLRHQGIYGYTPRTALALRALETVAAGARGSARAIARAGEWRKNSRGRDGTAARPASTRRRTPERSSASSLGRAAATPGTIRDEIHFCYRRCGEFVRQRPRGGFARHAARTARPARRLPEVRSLSQRRSGDDEPVSARRSLRPE